MAVAVAVEEALTTTAIATATEKHGKQILHIEQTGSLAWLRDYRFRAWYRNRRLPIPEEEKEATVKGCPANKEFINGITKIL
jgi:hypothetical protein